MQSISPAKADEFTLKKNILSTYDAWIKGAISTIYPLS